MNLYDMNKVLCEELCCEFEKFEHDRSEENFHPVYKLIKAMVGLQELEAAGAMRRYLEDEHGYDSYTGEFREMMYPRYGIYNAIPPMYPNPNPAYQRPMTAGDRRKMDGREYGRGYDDERMGDRDMNRDRDYRGIYNMAHDHTKKVKKLTESQYKEWVDNMVGADGSSGGMWDKAQTTAVAKKIGIDFKEYDEDAFWVAMNMVYSDMCEVMEKHGLNKAEVFAEMANAWLTDEDTEKGAEKLASYYEFVVEH